MWLFFNYFVIVYIFKGSLFEVFVTKHSNDSRPNKFVRNINFLYSMVEVVISIIVNEFEINKTHLKW